MTSGNVFDLPFHLRANDIVRHIINVDSRFRDNPSKTSASDFYLRVNPLVKNILRVRITSIEFPNNYNMFTAARKNTTFRIIYADPVVEQKIIVLEDGNYGPYEVVAAIQQQITDISNIIQDVSFNSVTGRFTFEGTQRFAIDTAYGSSERDFDYGLGYCMGFTRGSHFAAESGGVWTSESDQCASFTGDTYIFLKVNNFDCVSFQTGDQTQTALAKIILKQPKHATSFDDYASHHIKECVFPNPLDLPRLHVQLLDMYGNIMDICSSQFSFSLEVLEVRNLSLYNTIRDSLAVSYVS